MSAMWRGDLRNSVADVFIDTTLLVLTVGAYIPQLNRLQDLDSTRGLSAYYVLFNVFVSNAQLSFMLLCAAYAWPNEKQPVLRGIRNGMLRGRKAFGGILGLLQILVQWTCSVAVLISFTADSKTGDVSARVISIMAFIHTGIVLFPVLHRVFPIPSGPEFDSGILMALIFMFNQAATPCFLALGFCAQCWEYRAQDGIPGVLSLPSIGLQVPVIAAVGYRWFLRLGHPPWGYVPAPLYLWYQWAFPVVNHVAHALGCAVLLACFMAASRGNVEHGTVEDQ